MKLRLVIAVMAVIYAAQLAVAQTPGSRTQTSKPELQQEIPDAPSEVARKTAASAKPLRKWQPFTETLSAEQFHRKVMESLLQPYRHPYLDSDFRFPWIAEMIFGPLSQLAATFFPMGI